MKNSFTLLFLFLVLFAVKAQDRIAPEKTVNPEDTFKYDQVLPAFQMPDHIPDCENYIMDVMFEDDAKVRLRNGELKDLRTDATLGMSSVLDHLTWHKWSRFSEVPEETLDELCENGCMKSGQAVYNLNNIYRLEVPEQKNIWELGMALESLPGIIYARPVPKPAELPLPPDYQDDQGYLEEAANASSGIDAEYAWTRPGGTGTGITICDLEYSWNYNHADVTKALGSQINSNVGDPFSDNNHGTAVVGEMVSNNNGWGTKGICYNSSLKTCGVYYGTPSFSYNPAGAITLAISQLNAGDIILLEQQHDYTGSDDYVPSEWYGNYSPNAQTNNPVYAAIVNAVANGIHFVEAGGNGNVNTGNMTWFGNSGAVIVGAGGATVSQNLKKLGFSSYGPRFDVQGWGHNVTTTGYGGLYSSEGVNYYYTSTFNGTSSASPIVAGAIACFSGYWLANVSTTPPTPANMRAILKRHGRPQINPSDGIIGPRPNLEAMIKNYDLCTASGGCEEHISRVQFGSIDNASGCDGYVDYTSIHSTNLPLNINETITVTNGVTTWPEDECGIWVDWNRDGDFDDPEEEISVTGNPGAGPYTAIINPPSSATIGECVMRVRITYNKTPTPCGNDTFGEVEDYTINVTSAANNYWIGVTSTDWDTGSNWSLGTVPDFETPVYINPGTPFECVIGDGVSAYASYVFLEPGATLTQNSQSWFRVYGTFDGGFGQFTMNGTSSYLYLRGDNNSLWWDDNQDDTYTSVVIYKDNVDNVVTMQQDMTCSQAFQVYVGTLKLNNSVLTNTSTSSSAFMVNNNGKVELDSSDDGVTIAGSINFYDGSQAVISDGVIKCGKDFIVNSNTSYDIVFTGGGLRMNGSGDQYINDLDGGNFDLNNLVINKSGGTCYIQSADLDVNGGLLISGGTLSCNNGPSPTATYNISIARDWVNTVGDAGFDESTGRVTFDGGNFHQYCSSETFNALEINKASGGAFRLDGTTVTCNSYDWTAGALDVLTGTFTALDLVDNGIYGSYYTNPGGYIHLYQDESNYIDLNGHLIFSGGGEIHVYGGSLRSYWPYYDDASLNMNGGGILDFHDNGIYVYQDPDQTLTVNIDNGTIRTGGGFESNRADFTPSSGIVELYGASSAYVEMSNGSTLHNLVINKDAKGSTSMPKSGSVYDTRSGKLISDGARANDVLLITDVTVTNNLLIESGSLKLNSHTLNVANDITINGTLVMDNVADVLNAGASINWNIGSTADITEGDINLENYFFINDGSNVQIGIGNTINFAGVYQSSIKNLSAISEIGNLNVNMTSGTGYIHAGSTHPVHVIGDMTVYPGNTFKGQSYDLVVDGILDIQDGASMLLGGLYDGGYLENNGSLILSGQLDVDFDDGSDQSRPGDISEASEYGSGSSGNGGKAWQPGEVLAHGDFVFGFSGTLNILGGGQFIWDEPFVPEISPVYGQLNLDEGLFEVTNKSLGFYGSSTINGGLIRIGRSFLSTSSGSFNPVGGTIEFKGPDYGHYIRLENGNYFHNLVIDRDQAIQVHGGTDLEVKGDFTIDNGGLNSNSQLIFIGGHWNNNVGPDAFMEETGTVTFNGDWGQDCLAEEFFNLVLDKPTGDIQLFYGQTVTCQSYQWLQGEIHVDNGTFTAYDLYDNGIFGQYYISGPNATINLYQDDIQFVDLNGRLVISDGEMNIFGGSDASYWPYDANAEVQMAGGILDFHDRGIFINGTSTHTLTTNITGGLIRTGYEFFGEGSEFTPAGGYVSLYGDVAAVAGFIGTSHFHNLMINKAEAKENTIGTTKYIDRNGKEVTQTRATEVSAINDFTIEGDLIVEEGLFSLNGFSVDIQDDVSINEGAYLLVNENAQLLLSGSSTLDVNSGGQIDLFGTPGNEATVSHSSGYYDFNVLSGGTISASHTIFEYMGTVQGIHVTTGGLVDPMGSFNNCTFQNGNSAQANAALLTIGNAETILIEGASFPTTGTNFNVAKNLNQGYVTFKDYSGIFSGEDYDLDIYNRIEWFEPQLSANPTTINVLPPAGSTTFDITSNVDWTVTEGFGWLSVDPVMGSNDATVTINYDENPFTVDRTGTIIISAPDVPDVIVLIIQEGNQLAVSPPERNVSAAAGTTTFTVTCNTNWTATVGFPWLSIDPPSGFGNGVITVTYDENISLSSRMAGVNVYATGIPFETVFVNQAGAGAELIVSPSNQNVTPPAGVTSFEIISNTGWNVSESVAWINVSPTSGTGNGTLNVTYGENATGSSRLGNIMVLATGGSPSQTVSVSQASYPTHNISLAEGWSGLSSYIMPANNAIEDVFDPVSGSFIIAATMSEFYYPAGPVNTIIDWDSQSAYKLKMNGPATLPVIGNPETNKTLALPAGWSLVPVICNYPVDAATTLASLNLEVAKDVAGTGVLWPDMSINTLGNLNPGMAYYALLNTGGAFTFPANSDEAITIDPIMVKMPEHPWNEIKISSSSHLIAIVADGMEDILPGDVIGVFASDGQCYGITEVDKTGQNLVISVYADDMTTDDKDGFESGEPFNLKLYNPETGEEYDLEVVYDQNMPQGMFYENEGLSAISQLKLSATGINGQSTSAISIYPNPTNDIVWISGIEACNEITLMNNTGMIVLTRMVNEQGKISIDLSSLSSGVYQVRLSGHKSTIIRKVIKN